MKANSHPRPIGGSVSCLSSCRFWGWHRWRHLGAATVVALLVTGQMLGSIVFDHYGLFGLMQHPIDLSRLTGALLLIFGVVLIRH